MGNGIKHIVQVFLDIERPSGIVLTEEFVNYRLEFFLKYTYDSLMNQTFKDFEIWLICGRRHRDITGCLKCDEKRLRVIYPVAVHSDLTDVVGDTFTISPSWRKKPTLKIKEFGEQDADYLAITRIDSDDLLHRTAMYEIAEMSAGMTRSQPDERSRLIFREYIYWDMINHFISFQRWENPPFYTHVFPKDIYHNWDRLQREHFNSHRFMGGGREIGLTPNKVLVTYHEQNIARIKRGRSLNNWTQTRLDEFKNKGFPIEYNPSIMSKYLKEFGVNDYENIRHGPCV